MVQGRNAEGNGEGSEGERVRSVTPKAKLDKMIAVKRVHKEGPAALVEWQDGGQYRRGIVPVETVLEGKVAQSVLDASIPFGEKWSDVSGVTAALEQELYRQGVWTKEDLRARSESARSAIQQIYVVPLMKRLLLAAKE